VLPRPRCTLFPYTTLFRSEMSASLVGIISQVRGSSDNIATAASQIAAGNHDLADRTTAQAASLEETAASMEQLTSTVTQNSENRSEEHTSELQSRENLVCR